MCQPGKAGMMSKLYIPRPGAESDVGALTAPLPVEVASTDGAISIKHGVVMITKPTAAALTLAAPTAGVDDGKTLHIISATAAAHTVTLSGGLNGAGAGADVGTFAAAAANRFSVVAYNGAWWALGVNVNVTFA